ncbi:hypothetical protein AMJ49_03605 [Parcubacteria bacterium DG_74_2]|nr:MAG: hypothetical protein AMJ49_03605 [Parcubacteria bacterium DG_74_2]
MIEEELKLFKEEKPEPEYKIKETGEKFSLEWIKKIVSIYKERLKKLSEVPELTDFFFKKKLIFDKELLRWTPPTRHPLTERAPGTSNKEIKISLDKSFKILSKIKEEDWTKERIEELLIPEAEKFAKEIKKPEGDRGYLLWPLRVALTGKNASAGPFEIAEILGKKKTLQRIKEAK